MKAFNVEGSHKLQALITSVSSMFSPRLERGAEAGRLLVA
jgi:hypothetical protein